MKHPASRQMWSCMPGASALSLASEASPPPLHVVAPQALLLQQQQAAQHQMFLLQQAQLQAAGGGGGAYRGPPAPVLDPMAAWYAQHFGSGGAMAPIAAGMQAPALQVRRQQARLQQAQLARDFSAYMMNAVACVPGGGHYL